MEGDKTTEQVDPQLIDSVRKQVEYYFSRENLSNDAYLTSQMDASMSVPINVVMKFAKMKALTQDEAVVRAALAESTVVSIMDNRIKANIKASGRSTIILRDIPSDAPEEEVREIFNYPGCKSINSIRSDIGDTWFVVMDTEEDAKDTALDLKLKKRTFRGQSVKARIKTEAVVRSFYPVQPIPSIPAVFPVMPFAPIGVAGPIDMVPFGFVGVAPVTEVVVDNSVQSDIAEQNGGKNSDDADNGQGKGQSGARSSAPRADPRRTTRSGPARDTTADTRRRPEGPRRTTDTGRVGGKEREKKGTDGVAPKAPIEIDSISFPPLQATDDTPVPTPGYKDTYVKYTMDDIIAIVKNVKEAALPAELDANHHSLAITATPNLDLLKRQRTFSIDETREQLRQGRPVLKDAIIPGAVDYKSMMYGDDTHTKGAAAATAAATKKVDAVAPEVKKPEVEAEVKMDLGLTSPARLNSATWAAMVKSSAPAPLVEAGPVPSVPAPKVAPKPISAEKKAAAAPVTAPAAKSSTAPAKSGNNSRKEKGEQKDKKPNNKKKEKEGEDSKKSEHDDSKAVEESSDAPTSSWGGKISFATVLKQKLPEEATTEAPKKPTPAPSTNKGKTESNNKSNGDRTKGANSNGFARTSSRETTRDTSSKRSSNADADGMWVKETLPALPEK